MIRYSKGAAPEGLVEAAATPGADWKKGFHERGPVRDALLRDQRALCAYCQRRIPQTPPTDDQRPGNPPPMKIEHWIPRSDPADGAAAQFRWSNLLGVCSGVTDDWESASYAETRHCDSSREDARLFLHPVEGQGPNPRDHLDYRSDGSVVARGDDPRVAADIAALNLDAIVLRRGRVQALDSFRQLAAQHAYATTYLRRQLEIYERKAVAPEHFEVIRAYILKKLALRAG